MSAVVFLLFLAAAIGVPIIHRVEAVRRLRDRALEIGRPLGLELEPSWFGVRDAMSGEVEGVRVRISWTLPRERGRARFREDGQIGRDIEERGATARIVVDGLGRFPRSFSLEAESVLAGLGKLIAGADVEIQDERFDREILARGDVATIVALMDDRTRKLIRGLIGVVGVVVRDGRIEVSSTELNDPRQLRARVATLVELAQTMAIDEDRTIPARLLNNALFDPIPAVRRNNLSLLLAEYRGRPEAEEALAGARDDADPGVAVIAASAAGAHGLETLRSLASSATAGEEIRVVALRHLAKRAPELAAPVLDRALLEGSSAIRHLAIEAVGRMRHRPALPKLQALASDPDPATAALAAAALGWIGDPSSEAELTRLLEHASAGVRAAAARALGRVGSLVAVARLRPLTRRLEPAEVRGAAEGAIAQIKARRGNPDAGRLSVVAPANEGALSIDDRAGRLSRPAEGGELSRVEPAPDPRDAARGRPPSSKPRSG